MGVDGNGKETWQNGQDNILSIRGHEDFLQVIDDWSGEALSSKVVSAIGTEGRQERLVNLLGEIVKTAPHSPDGLSNGAAALELMAHAASPMGGHTSSSNGNGNGTGTGNRTLERTLGR